MNAIDQSEPQVHELTESMCKACQQVLESLKANVPGLISCGLVGPDGFEIAAVTTRPVEISKLSALTTTLIAVADAFAVESGLSACRDVILGTSGSCTLLLSIPVGLSTYAMFVTAGNDATLGSVLSNSRMCLAQIRETLTGQPSE